MSDVIKKMSDELPDSFFRFDIFLATNMTISSYHSGSAIEAVFFSPLGCVAHNKFLLK